MVTIWSCFDIFSGGRVGLGGRDRNSDNRANSIQLPVQSQTGTKLGNNLIHTWELFHYVPEVQFWIFIGSSVRTITPQLHRRIATEQKVWIWYEEVVYTKKKIRHKKKATVVDHNTISNGWYPKTHNHSFFTQNNTPSFIHFASFNFQPYRWGQSWTLKKPFLYSLHFVLLWWLCIF